MKSGPADTEHAAHELDRVLGLLRRDEPEDPHRVSLSLAKKAAAFFRMSRSSARIKFSRRNRRNSSRSSEVKPSASPASTSTWRDQLRSDCSEQPSSRASCGIGRPLERSKRTASARNSFEYGGVFGIDRHPLRPASRHSHQMSTKPGELHQTRPRAQSENLAEHASQRVLVAFDKAREGRVIGLALRRDHPKRD